jgi:general stress protein 26
MHNGEIAASRLLGIALCGLLPLVLFTGCNARRLVGRAQSIDDAASGLSAQEVRPIEVVDVAEGEDQPDLVRELDFEETRRAIVERLDSRDDAEALAMVLATSLDDVVQARNVLVFNRGLDLYFFTWAHSRKAKQIAGNRHVALCKGNLQIDGQAAILGGLFETRNRQYAELMRNKLPQEFDTWTQLPDMIIVRVDPYRIQFEIGISPTSPPVPLKTGFPRGIPQ